MKVICPEHGGVIVVKGNPISNTKNVRFNNLVIECPICEEEVIINGMFDYDIEGKPLLTK